MEESNNNNISKLKSFRRTLLSVAVWFFVSTVLWLTVAALVGTSNVADVWKISSTLLLISGGLWVSVNNFYRIASHNMLTKIVAIIALIANILTVLLWCMVTWGVFELFESSRYVTNMTDAGRVISSVTLIAVFGLVGSNMLAIREHSSNVRYLKIVSFAGLCGVTLFTLVCGIFDVTPNENGLMLYGAANLAFWVSMIAAWAVSRMIHHERKMTHCKDRVDCRKCLGCAGPMGCDGCEGCAGPKGCAGCTGCGDKKSKKEHRERIAKKNETESAIVIPIAEKAKKIEVEDIVEDEGYADEREGMTGNHHELNRENKAESRRDICHEDETEEHRDVRYRDEVKEEHNGHVAPDRGFYAGRREGARTKSSNAHRYDYRDEYSDEDEDDVVVYRPTAKDDGSVVVGMEEEIYDEVEDESRGGFSGTFDHN